MKRKPKLKLNHRTMPLRRIVRVEKQGGEWFTVLECKHASPGRSEAGRFARFYPCPFCYADVQKERKKHKPSKLSEMEQFRAELRRKLKGFFP